MNDIALKAHNDRLQSRVHVLAKENRELQSRIEAVRTLADEKMQEALDGVPPEYAERDMHGKYLRMDNYEAGQYETAEELREKLGYGS